MTRKTVHFKLPPKSPAPGPSDPRAPGQTESPIVFGLGLRVPSEAQERAIADNDIIPHAESQLHPGRPKLANAGFKADAAAMTDCGLVLMRGLQDTTGAWLTLTWSGFRRSIDGMDRLLRCRTPEELLALQGDLIRSHLEHALAGMGSIAQMTSRTARDAARTVASAAERTIDRPSAA